MHIIYLNSFFALSCSPPSCFLLSLGVLAPLTLHYPLDIHPYFHVQLQYIYLYVWILKKFFTIGFYCYEYARIHLPYF